MEIALRPTWVRLHPQLPPTLMWGYDGQVPGPTIEVRRGQRVRIARTNRFPKGSEYPVTSVEVPVRAPGTPPATTEPGREGVEPNKDVAALPAWPVTHLHGAQTGGGNDGWADNATHPRHPARPPPGRAHPARHQGRRRRTPGDLGDDRGHRPRRHPGPHRRHHPAQGPGRHDEDVPAHVPDVQRRPRLHHRRAHDDSGFDPAVGGTRAPIAFDVATQIPLAPDERGYKDVFRVPGGQILRVMGKFDGAYGRSMYHCHLLEYEDMGMMRPFVVMPEEAMTFDHGGAHGGHGEGHTG